MDSRKLMYIFSNIHIQCVKLSPRDIGNFIITVQSH